jgi:hypothetical protein
MGRRSVLFHVRLCIIATLSNNGRCVRYFTVIHYTSVAVDLYHYTTPAGDSTSCTPVMLENLSTSIFCPKNKTGDDNETDTKQIIPHWI